MRIVLVKTADTDKSVHTEDGAAGKHALPRKDEAPQRTILTEEGEVPLEHGKVYVEATTLRHDVGMLLLKIGVVVACFALLFTFVFGLFRVSDGGMYPALHDGDLTLYYRLDRNYVANDVVAVEEDGQMQALRVVAVAGDTVDITDDGLLVNGNPVTTSGVTEETQPFKEGISFPVTVGVNQVFLLGDARGHATDSRIYGCVDIDDTQGKVIGVLRRRNI